MYCQLWALDWWESVWLVDCLVSKQLLYLIRIGWWLFCFRITNCRCCCCCFCWPWCILYGSVAFHRRRRPAADDSSCSTLVHVIIRHCHCTTPRFDTASGFDCVFWPACPLLLDAVATLRGHFAFRPYLHEYVQRSRNHRVQIYKVHGRGPRAFPGISIKHCSRPAFRP